ncbi:MULTISPECIES: hypothetical protein [unclassified Bradyrhizobium]|uniref:hypothetical protein n=2 Tax=Nitrobacteraceae TaxID=41294 RepID=UPI0028E6D307|nr:MULTISPECIES: hypothetical protein [unclassified Bradyrhizobium]
MRKRPPDHPPGSHRPEAGVLVQMRELILRRRMQLLPARPEGETALSECDESAAVLPFPVRSEALLASLVPTLRGLYVSGEDESDPFLMTMSHGPRPRLSIDRDAYVELRHQPEAFLLKIAAAPDSKITFETPDFTTLVKFVLQYMAERHGEPRPGGSLS